MSGSSHRECELAPEEVLESSASQRLEDELRTRVRQQEATGRLGLLAFSGADLFELMKQTANVVFEVLAVEYCEILELLLDGTGLLLRAGSGWQEGYVGRATVGINLESQAGYTLISKGPVIVEDLRTEMRFSGPSLLREHRVVSGISTTIYIRGHVYGVLGAYTTRRREFTEDEVLFLQEVADVLGAAIERNRVERPGPKPARRAGGVGRLGRTPVYLPCRS